MGAHEQTGTLKWTLIRRGVGRPSRINVEADKAEGAVTAIRVGGSTVLVGERHHANSGRRVTHRRRVYVSSLVLDNLQIHLARTMALPSCQRSERSRPLRFAT